PGAPDLEAGLRGEELRARPPLRVVGRLARLDQDQVAEEVERVVRHGIVRRQRAHAGPVLEHDAPVVHGDDLLCDAGRLAEVAQARDVGAGAVQGVALVDPAPALAGRSPEIGDEVGVAPEHSVRELVARHVLGEALEGLFELLKQGHLYLGYWLFLAGTANRLLGYPMRPAGSRRSRMRR